MGEEGILNADEWSVKWIYIYTAVLASNDKANKTTKKETTGLHHHHVLVIVVVVVVTPCLARHPIPPREARVPIII